MSYARRLQTGAPTTEWEGSAHATNDNARLSHTRCLSDLHMSLGASDVGEVGGRGCEVCKAVEVKRRCTMSACTDGQVLLDE